MTASAIWSPTRSTGLRLLIGSWNTIAISGPRIRRIVSANSRTRSRRCPVRSVNSIWPAVIRPPVWSISRVMESAVTDLPEPDSPTIASVSPSAMCRSKSRTTVAMP